MSLRKTRRKKEADAEMALGDGEDEPTIDFTYLRIKAPIVWEEGLVDGIIIQDIQEERHDEIIEFIKSSFMRRETMCKSIHIMDDPESVEGYEEYIRSILNDSCSIMALKPDTSELIGVLIIRIMRQDDYGKAYSRMRITKGDKFEKILDIQRHLNRKSDIYEIFDCNKFIRYYLIDARKDYEQAIGLSMLKCGYKVAKSLKVPVVMGIFSTMVMQEIAKIFGMKILNEVYYVDWREGQDMVFDSPGVGNYTIALMAGPVPPPRTSQSSLLGINF